MINNNSTKLLLGLVITFLTLKLSAQTTSEIIDIGPGGVSGLSKNGQYVCGMNYPSPGFVWNSNSGRIELSNGNYSEAYDVSNNGRVAGRFYDPTLPAPNGNPTLRAAYWENGNWNRLNGIDGLVPLDEMSFTHAYGISADGSTIVGMQWRPNWTVEAVVWHDGNIQGLGQIYNKNSRANVVSANGSVIAGWNAGPDGVPDRMAYYWNPAPHFIGGFDQSYLVGESRGISSDGSVIVGGSIWPFIWTEATGMLQVVADSSHYSQGYALGISDNGTIVGFVDPVGGGFNYKGFIKKYDWSDIVYLSVYIKDSLGITGYNGWDFTFAQAISADGNTIGISAYSPLGEARALVLKINQPLPVELTSFTASSNNGVVNLNWHTATEINNSGFDIEKLVSDSQSAQSYWIKLGFVCGNGTTTSGSNYSFIDQTPSAGKNIYRLKQIDFNGTFEYSHEVETNFYVSEYTLLQNYPNPFNPTTTIKFSIPKDEFVSAIVFNSLGEKVAVLSDAMLNAGSHSLTFNANGLSSGLYILKVTSGSFTKSIKMNLIK